MKIYYIYVINQGRIERISAPGFDSEGEAETHLIDLIEKRKNKGHNIYFERDWYRFIILPTYQSKQAFYLADKNKNFEFIEGIPLDTATILCTNEIKTLSDIEKCTYEELLEKFNKIPDFINQVDNLIKKFHLSLKR